MTGEAITAMAPGIGTRAACAAAGVPQASWYRRHRISPLPPRRVPVPHAGRVQPRALVPAERQAILDVLHCSGSPTPPRPKCGRRCWMRAPTWPRCPPSTGSCARRAKAASGGGRPPTRPLSSPSWQPPAEPGLLLGHHQAAWPGEMDLLLPVRDLGHLQPLRRGLDGRHPRVRRPCREADRSNLRQAGHHGRAADHPRRPGQLDDLQAGRVPARRPGRHPVTPGPTSPTTIPTPRPSSRP